MNIFKSNIEKIKRIINRNDKNEKEIEKNITEQEIQEEKETQAITIKLAIKEKKVRVIDQDNQEQKVEQFCKHVDDDKVLLADTEHDKKNKVYHTYLDCYEDWSDELKEEFKKWKITDKKNIENYKKCARCQEREYREKHPNAKIMGYNFHYYFEELM